MGSEAPAPDEDREATAADLPLCERTAALTSVEPPQVDAQIVAAIGRGRHRDALQLCAEHHGAAVGRLCMAMTGSQAEADDLTQDTLLAAHDAFANYRAEGSPRAFLCGIARRMCARHLERRASRESKLRLVDKPPPPVTTDDNLIARERARTARAALSEVRPTEREALVLRYVCELTYRELGDAFDIEEAAARKRVSRAVARLRSVLASKE